MRPVPWLLALFLALLTLPQPAAASYPCPGGPGPGEVQVGVSGGSHGVAATPMCQRSGGGADGSGGGGGVSYIYGSIAWHPDVDDVWMAGLEASGAAAQREALDACTRTMGSGCQTIGDWNNSSMTVFRDSQGALYNSWDGHRGAQRKAVLADCSARQVLPCETLRSFGVNQRRYAPAPTARKLYASAAWVYGDGFNQRMYIASGHRDADAADKAALDACRAATGQNCGTAAFVGNGLIQPFRLGADPTVLVERNARRAKQAAEGDCKRKRRKCTVQRGYDSRTPGQFVHDFTAAATR